MKAIKFLIVWGLGILLLKYAVFDYVAQFTKDPSSLATISFLSILVWTTVSGIVTTRN